MLRTTWLKKIVVMLFGVLICIVILEIGLRVGGFACLFMQEYRNRAGLDEGNAYRILCLGDSTTAGSSPTMYPQQLEEILNATPRDTSFVVINKGMFNVDTTDIMYNAPAFVETYKPQIVIAMMGTNDSHTTVPHRHTMTHILQSFRTYKFACLIAKHIRTTRSSNFFYEGVEYKDKHEWSTAQELFYKETLRHPQNVQAHVELGWCYYYDRLFNKAEKTFKRVLSIEPSHLEAVLGLGLTYGYQGRKKESEELLTIARKENPNNHDVLMKLCIYYRDTRDYTRAIPLFEEVIPLDPHFSWLYSAGGECLMGVGRIREAISMFKKALIFLPDTDDHASYINLAQCYEHLNKLEKAAQYKKKAESLQSTFYSKTRTNYRTLYTLLKTKGIQLVCVQYPMRPVSLLKKIFPNEDDILFVDNEAIFKHGVQEKGYNYYFDDRFAGDFGHCSPEGNRLLAENIARVILTYVNNVTE
ncbi:MAG: tetratricopeptide repeat protein [Candidatus Omnitrophica bacterium]|nr:tetratricopeptide repeat protein [Candidatus Omnitrophota bacterium]